MIVLGKMAVISLFHGMFYLWKYLTASDEKVLKNGIPVTDFTFEKLAALWNWGFCAHDHQASCESNCANFGSWFSCLPLDKVYIIWGLPTRQVGNKIYSPGWIFNLPQATGQSLTSHPAVVKSVKSYGCRHDFASRLSNLTQLWIKVDPHGIQYWRRLLSHIAH